MLSKIHGSLLIVVFSPGLCGAAQNVNGNAIINGPAPPEPPAVVSRDEQGRATLRAVRIDTPLDVDGRLEENIYVRTAPIDGFIQQEPLEGDPATEKTEVWIFFGPDNVYISARCWDSHPERMVANEMRRDNRAIESNENFAVILDTFYDRRNGFLFSTNTLGALYDAQVTDERTINDDWNTIWDVRTGRFAEGWTVEMELPFKSLRYKEGGAQIWGINFRRSVSWKNEDSFLTPIAAAYGRTGLLKLSSAATLVGVEPPVRSMNLELKPYVTSGVRTNLTADEPYKNDPDGDVGFDVKYGVTRSLVLDVTYHTDFAQVEDDDQQVNLTRFSLYYPEKREFFLEGQGIFGFGGTEARGGMGGGGGSDVPIPFFSRQIGLTEGEVVPINVGGRLTGRAGRYTIGLLNIQTDDVPESEIPTTNFSVVRVKRDILRRSNIGFIGTHRSEAVDTDGSNSVFGVDANFAFYQNLNAHAYYARSRTDGMVGDDATYRGNVVYGSDLWGFGIERLVVEENFNPEIGFVRREDFRKSRANFRFSPRPRSIEAIRKFTWSASIDNFSNGDGILETRQTEIQFRAEMENGDSLSAEYTRTFDFLEEEFDITDDVIIPVGEYSFQNLRGGYHLGPQRRISGGLWFDRGSFYSGDRAGITYYGRVEVTGQFTISPSVSINWIDLPEGEFTTNLMRARVNYALSPRMFIATLIQYNSESDSLSSNVRFRWEYKPGSDLFVVYSDGRDALARGYPDIENQSLVVKFTHLFRF